MSPRDKAFHLFYGWWIVAATFLAGVYIGGTVFYGFTAFFEPIASDLNWSYTQVSIGASLRGLETGILAPFVGILADRWGPRRLLGIGAFITAAGLAVIAATHSLTTFYSGFALVAIGTSACTQTVMMTAIANWFRRNVGLASGIAMCGFGFSGFLIPLIVRLIQVYDWRTTMNLLALGMVLLVVPLAGFLRHKPEQYGQLPDGLPVPLSHLPAEGQLPAESEPTVREAVGSRTFWTITLTVIYTMMTMHAVTTHVMPYLSSMGFSRYISGLAATAIPLTSIVGRLGLGGLGDRYDKRLVMAAGLALVGGSLLLFTYTTPASLWLLVIFLVINGIGNGGTLVLRPSLCREFFGRKHFGGILGLIIGIGHLGSLIGPTAAGWAYDNWGGYQTIWLVFAGLAVIPTIATLLINPASTAGDGFDAARHSV
ncbi:MAG: MFS transporter [Chloroflexota bacterium]